MVIYGLHNSGFSILFKIVPMFPMVVIKDAEGRRLL